MVATKYNLREMMKLKPRILHISCHGITKEGNNHLIFESDNGEAIKISEKDLDKALDLSKDAVKNLDLVYVAACQSEFVGELFNKYGAQHVICIDKKASVLDEVAIDFTLNLYQLVLNGVQISEAF